MTQTTSKSRKIPRIFKLSILVLFVLTASCKKETKEKIQNVKNEVKAATKIASNAQTLQEKTVELSQKKPLTSEDLKSWLPKSINGMERTAYKVGNTTFANTSSVRGTYKNGDQEFTIELIDGAGPMAGLVLMSGMTNRMEMEEEDETKHMKNVKKDDIEARETYFKDKNLTTLKFLYNDRFLVDIRAEGTGVGKTWDMVKNMDLESLYNKTE